MKSRPPNCLTVFATAASTCSGRLTSHCSTRKVNFSASACACNSLLAAASMPSETTLAPPFANRFAIARPIPVVPVTIATLPSNSFMWVPVFLFVRCPPKKRNPNPSHSSIRAPRRAAQPALSAGPRTNIPDSFSFRCHRPANAHDRDASEPHDLRGLRRDGASLPPARHESRRPYPSFHSNAPPHRTIHLPPAPPAVNGRNEFATRILAPSPPERCLFARQTIPRRR